MPNIVDRFGQLVDDAIPKPELARQLLLLGYRAKDVQLLLAPEKELTPARQYAAQIAMDAMIAPLAHPQRAALVNIFMPCELLHAFHLLPMFAEATACYLNGAAAERGFIHYAESAGISPTLCSYHKALLGMGLSGTAGKPLFTACTSIACDANNLTFRRLAQHYGIPHFYLDVPYDHDEYAVAEVSDRLREFAAFLEDATHQKLDEAALQQAVAHSGRTLELLQQAQAAKAGRNLHNDVTSEFYEVFVTHTMLGTPQAEQYARKLLADIEAGVRFDVLFLDVLMPGINGINAAREIRRYDTAVQIIFVTSSSEFAVQSYVVGAYYYQLKPIWKDSFFRLTDAVLAECRKRTQHSLILRCKSGVTRITLDSLEYCEVQGRTLVFHLLDGTVIESSGSMDALARQLADYPGFLRPHRSYLVNMEYIQNITAKSITMESLAEVPLPHGRFTAVRDQYLEYSFAGKKVVL